MDIIYKSKGISKAAVVRKLMAVVLLAVLMVGVFVLSESKVKGATNYYTIGGLGGKTTAITETRHRFSADERQGLQVLAFVFGAAAMLEALEMGVCRASWTEIRRDTVKGSFLGKTVSYGVKDITNVSELGGYLILSGAAGKAVLVTENPKKARKAIDDLLLNR